MKIFFFEILKSITAHSRSLIFFFFCCHQEKVLTMMITPMDGHWSVIKPKKKTRQFFFFLLLLQRSITEIDDISIACYHHHRRRRLDCFFFRIFFSLEKFTHNISLGFQRFFFFFSWLVSRRKHTHITHEMRKISKFSIFFSKMKSCSVFDLDLFTFPWQKKRLL